VQQLVNEVIKTLTAETPDRAIAWKVGVLPRAIGDPSLIRQVLLNLLRNSVKYTGNRELAEIEVGVDGAEECRMVVKVKDNGVGFEMQYASKLFGVFQRLHRSDEFEGTGIGLATVRNIIARHGGRTWGIGEPGIGATFFFTLRDTQDLAKK
jgi:light-regulated signal transduction histidine kinase (bacteriophytochrome)